MALLVCGGVRYERNFEEEEAVAYGTDRNDIVSDVTDVAILPIVFCDGVVFPVVSIRNFGACESQCDGPFMFFRIRQLVVPATMKRIEDCCFCWCRNLSDITFEPDSSLEFIGREAFRGTSLRRIFIPAKVKNICENCFRDCQDLWEIYFDDHAELLTLGKGAFWGCPISRIEIPTGVKVLPCCFQECSLLEELTFGWASQLREIESEVFVDTWVKAVEIPKGCVSLTGLSLLGLESVTLENGSGLTLNESKLLLSSDGTTAIRYFGDDECFDFPSRVQIIDKGCFCRSRCAGIRFGGDCKVEEIRERGFCESNVNEISIPSSVESIGAHCFSECSSLRRLVFQGESKLKTVGEYAFWKCGLEGIEIPERVSGIPKGCFGCCGGLLKGGLRLPSGLCHIGAGAFAGLSSEFVEIPADCGDISANAFDGDEIDGDGPILPSELGCRMVLSEDGKELVKYHEGGEGSSEKVRIPKGVEVLGEKCFALCNRVKEVHFEEGSEMTKFGFMAFCGSSIEKIVIPWRVRILGQCCFSKCKSLHIVSFEPGPDGGSELIEIGAGCFMESGIEKFELPSKVEVVRTCAFQGCLSLSKLMIMDGRPLKIECQAFGGTCVTYVDFGSREVTLEMNAFGLDAQICGPNVSNDGEFGPPRFEWLQRIGNSKPIGKCIDVISRKKYAIQICRLRSGSLPFAREVQVLHNIKHPCIVHCLGWVLLRCYGDTVILTEFREWSLDRVLVKVQLGKGVPDFWTHTKIAKMIVGLVLGMEHLHANGIIHGDLRPPMILLDNEGRPEIRCFEGWRMMNSVVDATGRYDYMSPEVMRCGVQTGKVDIFGFGLILYEILVGKPVFDPRIGMFQLETAICGGSRPEIPEGVTSYARKLIAKCWSANPDLRPCASEILLDMSQNEFAFYDDVDAGAVAGFIAEVQNSEDIQPRLRRVACL